MRSVEKSAFPSLLVAAFVFAGAGIASADTITQTTIMPGVTDVMVTPPDQVVTSERMMIVPTPSSSSTTTISKSVETVNSGLGLPKFDTRIQHLREQLNKAIVNGWITSTEAVSFSNRLNDLGAVQNTASAEVLEKQLNQINIELSNRMTH